MTDKIQRRQFIVGDMVLSGEKEGPLEPTPVYPGVIVMGENPLKFDRTVCSLMGFDYRKIPLLNSEELFDANYPVADRNGASIYSNNKLWHEKSMDEIREEHSLCFQPTLGWTVKLGNRYRDKLYGDLLQNGMPVCIFGAGANGIYAAEELRRQ